MVFVFSSIIFLHVEFVFKAVVLTKNINKRTLIEIKGDSKAFLFSFERYPRNEIGGGGNECQSFARLV